MMRRCMLLVVTASALAMGLFAKGVRRQMRWGVAQCASCACSSCAWHCVRCTCVVCAGLTGAGGWGWSCGSGAPTNTQRQRRILPGAGSADGAARGSLRLRGGQAAFVPPAGQHVIVLDVDGTLYGAESGIEQQIVANIYRFALSCCELTPEECDALHRRHGSTIAGLKSEKKISKDLEDRFYREVYGAIDYSRLLGAAAEGDASGYKHSCSVRELLLRSGVRVAIASNSPSWHVHRVLRALGLSRVPWCAILTPDLVGGFTKSDPLFWSPILEKYHPRREGGEAFFTQCGHFHIGDGVVCC